ncbi:MAG: DUF5320 domain-containing protein, partial [Deltaproteobacteria bacterium]|nr:DUF5320 domain-containing protein [Deltaproteobacteria bacterium]
MPDYDQKGPWGEGPRTGRARGRCGPVKDVDRDKGGGPGRGLGKGHRWRHGRRQGLG